MTRDINELEVYKQSLKLIKELYELLSQVPSTERDLESQLKRASKSIPANIAEGLQRNHRCLLIALASSDEVLAHLQVLSIVQPRLKPQV